MRGRCPPVRSREPTVSRSCLSHCSPGMPQPSFPRVPGEGSPQAQPHGRGRAPPPAGRLRALSEPGCVRHVPAALTNSATSGKSFHLVQPELSSSAKGQHESGGLSGSFKRLTLKTSYRGQGGKTRSLEVGKGTTITRQKDFRSSDITSLAVTTLFKTEAFLIILTHMFFWNFKFKVHIKHI